LHKLLIGMLSASLRWHRRDRSLYQLEQRLDALEAHAAVAAEVLAHAEQMLNEWRELVPVLREIRLEERRGR